MSQVNTCTFLGLFTKTSRGITNSDKTRENQMPMHCWAAFHFPQMHYCERFFQETLDTNQVHHRKGSYINLRTLCVKPSSGAHCPHSWVKVNAENLGAGAGVHAYQVVSGGLALHVEKKGGR